MIKKVLTKLTAFTVYLIITVILGYVIFEEEKERLENKTGQETLEDIADLLKVYTVYDANGTIELIRNGKDGDGGYVVPEKALSHADALIGYGVCDDISFEENFSDKYNKESYGFDCSIKDIAIKNKLTHFVPECIGTYNGTNSGANITSFPQQLQKLKYLGKKLFIKMDIEGAEYDAMPQILKDAKNITGIAMELHFNQKKDRASKVLKLLTLLDEKFFLVHVHGNNCCGALFSPSNVDGAIPRVMELSYINKNLVSHAAIAENQTHPTTLDSPNIEGNRDLKFAILVQKHS